MRDAHIAFIRNQINKSTIESKEVKDDLLDHFCCAIEVEMEKGSGFEEAYQSAFQQITPNGVNEIQHELFLTMFYQKLVAMKQLTYVSGFIFSLAFTLGTLFKVLHLPSANILCFGGLSGLAFLFVPLLLADQYRNQKHLSKAEKTKGILALLSGLLLASGSIMKILHKPGAAEILGMACLLFSFGFLPFLFIGMYKKSKELTLQS